MNKPGRPKKNISKAKTITEFESILVKEGRCMFLGIGVFDLRPMKARRYRDHWNNKIIKSRPYIKVGFKPSKKLAETLNLWNSKQ